MADIDTLIEQLSQDAAKVTPARHPYAQCLKWLLGFAVYAVLLTLVSHPRPDLWQKLHAPLFLAEIASLLFMVATCALSAALLSFPDMLQKKALAAAPIVSFTIFLAVLVYAGLANPPAPPPEHEMECTLSITLMALLPALWMFASMRKAASTHAGLAGYIATLCAFSLGALTLRLSEQTDSISHVVQWHYAPILLLSGAGMWLGKRLLKW